MAKKDISKFQKALLSKTNVMKEALQEEVNEPIIEQITVSNDANFKIDEKTLDRYKLLAQKHNKDLNKLLHFGLDFFLEFEEELFEK